MGSILVVDDIPANLELLAGMLTERGYRVRPAPSGELALRGAAASPPDLVLLDVNMPEMDGYEVCRRLKADERLRDIPVLFISALTEPLDKVRAFQSGGVDFVTKPFNFEEVEARVRTHLELRRQKRELAASLARMRDLERLRDSLTHMIAHDMKSPLATVQLCLDLLDPMVPEADPELVKVLLSARMGVDTIVEMINQMLDISRMEAGAMQLNLAYGDVVEAMNRAVEANRLLFGARRLEFRENGPIFARFDANLLRRIAGNLIGNAVKFTAPDGIIGVTVARGEAVIRVELSDNGWGIAPEHHAKIFEKFGQIKDSGARVGTGLGLTFVRMAVEAHGGTVGVVSAAGKGSTFWFTLPAVDEPIHAAPSA